MTAELAPSIRLTVADYDEILSAGLDYFERVNALVYLRRDKAEADLFRVGALVDDDGRQLVVNLMMLGYPRAVAMRVALHLEARRG